MAWQIAFVENENESVAVRVNGEFLRLPNIGTETSTWVSSDGTCRQTLPPAFKDLLVINIDAQTKPEDKNATILLIWDGKVKKVMNFDATEAHDIDARDRYYLEDIIQNVLAAIPECT